MSKKEIDFDEELEKIARKSNVNIRKSEYAFENQLKKTNDCFIHLVRVKASNVFYPQEKNLYAK